MANAVSTFLLQGQVNTKHLLNFFTVDDNGFLKDASEIGFMILDEAGTQNFPAGPGDFESVKTTDGHFGTGSYYAYDQMLGGGPWVVDGAATLGTWTCRWRFKLDAGDDYTVLDQLFQVEDSAFGVEFGYRTLISPTQVRQEGISVLLLSDARMAILIDMAQQFIETRCGTYFRPIPSELKLNALFSEAMMLNIPVIGIDYVKANGSTSALSKSGYAVNNARVDLDYRYSPQPDPRRNPYIRFRTNTWNPRFTEGPKMQKVRGVFGWLETDGTVPALVTYAMLRLIYNNAISLTPSSGHEPAGPILSETVDRHTITYASSGSASMSWALATSKEVEEVIAMYKRPIGLGTTAPTWPLPMVR